MTPRAEFTELFTRSRTLISAVLLLIASAGHLIVSVGMLFCGVFVTAFTMGRNTVDRVTARVAVDREASFHVLS